uniref:Dof-type domain-containing protein n=1 Tax=Oryza punctata TaxID=4537 RepID=A0A0E0KXP4_ORYPU
MIFPPAFLDSSSWNDNNNQQQQQQQQQQHAHGHHQHHQVAAGCGGGGGGDGNSHELMQQSMMPGTLPDGGGGAVGPAKPMSMSERARLARIPLPEPGLKCPRCDSTNTNRVTSAAHAAATGRAVARSATSPSGSSAATTTAGSTPAGSTTSSTCTTANAPALPAMLGGNLSILPPLLRLADFDAMSLGSTFSGMAGKPPVDAAGCYSIGGATAATGLEQWRLQQMQSFPFFHAMDHQAAMATPPAMAMPGMFQLGLDGDGHGGGEDGGELHHAMPSKREAGGYPRGMYGDHHLAGGYTSYSSATTVVVVVVVVCVHGSLRSALRKRKKMS